jgi:tetratricopeptide (TPR) repeat protein
MRPARGQRNIVWRTEESLWRDVTEKSPKNGRGLTTYGVLQMRENRLAEAEEYFNRALQYTPQYAYLHVNLGVLKGAQHKGADAERHFLEAQQYDARNPVVYYHYAAWLASIGRTAEAEVLARRAIELSPAHIEAQQLLSSLEVRRPTTAEGWLDLSLRQYQSGFFELSIESSREALKLRPGYAEAPQQHLRRRERAGAIRRGDRRVRAGDCAQGGFPARAQQSRLRAQQIRRRGAAARLGIIPRGEARGLLTGAQ